jgi:hypothetical protein
VQELEATIFPSKTNSAKQEATIRGVKIQTGGSHPIEEGAGFANPESERTARSEQTRTANSFEQSVRLLGFFEIALALVGFDHVASRIVKANQSIM